MSGRGLLVGLMLTLGVATVSVPVQATPSPWPAGVALPAGEPLDESYRQEFGVCDRADRFHGHAVHGCRNDPNAVTALRRLPGGAIAYVAKLAVDLDGSPFACSPDHGAMDQCPTSLMLPDGKGGEIPVDADKIPYVVIPWEGPHDEKGRFTKLTGVDVGDFGVVIAHGRTIPVIVADTGPFEKLGEGSLALHRALGRELCIARSNAGTCRRVIERMESIGGDVTTVLFPHSAREGVTPANIAQIVREEGLRRWQAFQSNG
ncbi:MULTISPECIES: glycoside hydrolase family 75 protein [unclassified Sphingomonas]|uniref:glycoside hydrolase family 75 protein n=1 Tax=unclassified Sphingomonas TaxID=196159 RepID=UPI001F5A8612|nr:MULTISPECIES: glycoside hydrolase family 75 protein [unclassified Sphingomonas]